MQGVNNCMFIGVIYNDPKHSDSRNIRVCRFTLKVEELRDKQEKPTVAFIPVVCFGSEANKMEQFGKKGMCVWVHGKYVHYKLFSEKENMEKQFTEISYSKIVFLDPVTSKNDNNDDYGKDYESTPFLGN